MPATTTEKYDLFFFSFCVFIIFAYCQRQIPYMRLFWSNRFDGRTVSATFRCRFLWFELKVVIIVWHSAFQVNAIFAFLAAITFVWNQWLLIDNTYVYNTIIITLPTWIASPNRWAHAFADRNLRTYELFKQFPKANWILRLIAATNLPSIKRNDCEEVRQHFLWLKSKLISLG